MSEIPEYIWLQVYGDGSPEDGLPDFSTDEITWCQDAINEHDVKYVRADKYEKLGAEIKDLIAEISTLKGDL